MSTPDPQRKSALPLSTPPDPVIVKRHLREIRHAEHAVVQAKHWLASYLSTHAPATSCQATRVRGDLVGTTYESRCAEPVDGVLIYSCGDHSYLCASHGSDALRAVQGRSDIFCSGPTKGIRAHDGIAYGVTLEWQGLS